MADSKKYKGINVKPETHARLATYGRFTDKSFGAIIERLMDTYDECKGKPKAEDD